MNNAYRYRARIPFFILIGLIAVFLFGGAVMLLWNNILVPVLHISAVTYGQAFGILVLSKILFGGFRGGWQGRRQFWKGRMMEKWNAMTPEQKEKFRAEWGRRCGSWNEPRTETGSQANA
jgi:hypothetical protein